VREEVQPVTQGDGGSNRNRTVFRPSPLQRLKREGQPPPPPLPAADEPGWGATPPADPGFAGPSHAPAEALRPDAQQPVWNAPAPEAREQPAPGPAMAPSRLGEDDVPLPATPREVRNIMLAEASPLLALAAGIRSGRVRMSMPRFHHRATEVIAAFDQVIAQHYSNETRQRAKYAVCATIDDIAQNLPGTGAHAAEWARRSLVVGFFHENISGDRFWQLVDDMLRYPNDNRDLIELCHACLAAGFEGRFRVMPDGQRRLHEIMARLQGALEHVRNLSPIEIVREWKGEKAPLRRVGFWAYVGMAAAAAAGLLFLVYAVMSLILMNTGESPDKSVAALMPDTPLGLSRAAAVMPMGDSAQLGRLKKFLEPEIRQHLVKVLEDGQTVRVRTTVGQLFKSADDQLEPGREALFDRIGKAIETERGPVTVEGHADSDRVSSLRFPDNMALSEARADTVAGILRRHLSKPDRVTTKGYGDSHPIASNSTAAGKSQNRRVEVVLQRTY
jgi:type VI secretion system protein ImpK